MHLTTRTLLERMKLALGVIQGDKKQGIQLKCIEFY